MIRLRPRNSIETLLAQQVEIIGATGVSLHCLWRAMGSPVDRTPELWIELAAPLIDGVVEYLAALPQRPSSFSGNGPLLKIWRLPDCEPWRQGDLIAHELLARVYALFLDPIN